VRRCAFLTTNDLTGFVTYDHLAVPPLEAFGWRVDNVPWRATGVDWAGYDAVVIRSTWDYQAAPAAFMEVLERIARETVLHNGIETVRWNLRKSYLRDIAAHGGSIVPTRFSDGAGPAAVRAAFEAFGTDQLVLKPEVGANADDATRLRADGGAAPLERAAALFRGRGCLIQPFVPAVVAEGEYSLVWFDGAFSHAILKTPKRGDFRVQEEHGGVIRSVVPEPSLEAAAQQAMHALEAATGAVPLYARLDLVRLEDGGWGVMELELIEPSLYFPYDAQSPQRFAAALTARSG
jgi:glutathione synthase/RimK-type ligase-like ATP-grasp enzyme